MMRGTKTVHGGYEVVAERGQPSAPPKVWTRAEIAGLAAAEAQLNHWYGHGDHPSDWYFATRLAAMDAAA